jgi:mRNA-degrading endonuclease toxin of MazEF toxin-antitoxin module
MLVPITRADDVLVASRSEQAGIRTKLVLSRQAFARWCVVVFIRDGLQKSSPVLADLEPSPALIFVNWT